MAGGHREICPNRISLPVYPTCAPTASFGISTLVDFTLLNFMGWIQHGLTEQTLSAGGLAICRWQLSGDTRRHW